MTRHTAKTLRDADGGYASRKLWFAVGTSFAIVGIGVLAAFVSTFRPCLETVVGGVIGVYALYAGANVGGKLAIGKAGSYVANVEASEPTPKPPVEPLPE